MKSHRGEAGPSGPRPANSGPPLIDILDHVPSYEEFLRDYLLPNRPCIMPSGLIQDWPALRWADEGSRRQRAVSSDMGEDDALGKIGRHLGPAFYELATRYGHHVVPVVKSPKSNDEVLTPDRKDEAASVVEDQRLEMPLSQALSLMVQDELNRYYVKDWHLVRQERALRWARPSDPTGQEEQPFEEMPYTTPDVFADDWMNNDACNEVRREGTKTLASKQLDSTRRQEEDEGGDQDGSVQDNDGHDDEDDFRFCYAGEEGTTTGLHRDVYTSYSWSSNVVGRKRWRLFPPGSKHLRRFPNNRSSELADTVDRMDARQSAGELGSFAKGKAGWEGWKEARQACLEVIQEEHTTIFVPSDWYHEVTNLTHCISLNHNWCNSVNLISLYDSMCQEVADVEMALSDVFEILYQGQGAQGSCAPPTSARGFGGSKVKVTESKPPSYWLPLLAVPSTTDSSSASQNTNANSDHSIDSNSWAYEWTTTVQSIAKRNAGWCWSEFFSMLLKALSTPPSPPSLSPEPAFVARAVLTCLEGVQERSEWPWLDEEVHRKAEACQRLCEETLGGQARER